MPLVVGKYLWLDGQMGGAVAYTPDNTVSQQAGQSSVNRGVRLAEDAC